MLRKPALIAVAATCIALGCGEPEQPALQEPSILDRAAEISQIQRGRTGPQDEERILQLFLETQGLELTELKERVDAGRDHRDLQQLVYRDIDDPGRRARIVAHLRNQAARVRERHGPQGVKVLSDIDDTVYPNFADRRAWSLDRRPYPGVIEFYEGLTGVAAPGRSRLTLVSARPEDRLGILEGGSSESLRRLGLPEHTILSGTAWTLASIAPGSLGERAVAEIGEEKLRDFQQWSELMGEFDFVISGDRSQADHVFAAEALELEDSHVLAGFIHDVGEAPLREAPRLFYNETILGHALDAHEAGWLDLAALRRVGAAVAAGRAAGVYPEELGDAVERDLARVEQRSAAKN
jgi:hypothetical protein